MFIFVYYGVALLVPLGVGAFVFWRLRRRDWRLRVFGSLLSALALLFVWPILTHGSFTTLAAIMFHELRDQWPREAQPREAALDTRLVETLEARFAGVMEYEYLSKLSGSWSAVALNTGERAWLDQRSGLVWSAPRAFVSASPLSDLEAAKALCHEQQPSGYWALPTEAERHQFWRANGVAHLPDKVAPAMGFLVGTIVGLDVPTVTVPPKNRGNFSNSGTIRLMLRCVGRGPTAPARGYVQRDIPLSEWNERMMR